MEEIILTEKDDKQFNIKKGQPVNKGDVLVEIEL